MRSPRSLRLNGIERGSAHSAYARRVHNAAWMIMAGDDGGGVGQERSGEHLARLCCGRSYVG
jgi:hypothetical protein